MRRSFLGIVSIIVTCMCGCNGSDAEPTPVPMSPTQTISPTDEPELTIEPQPTMSEKDIYFMEKEQREEERKALLASPTPGPEPYALLETDKEVKVGDVVTMGEYCHNKYPHGSYYTKFPIKWLVLENEGNRALLVSLFNVNVYPFIKDDEYFEIVDRGELVCWKSSTVRTWLNEGLYQWIFTEKEKSCVCESVIHTPDNPIYGTDGGEDTTDYLFLLSIEEAENYFPTDEARKTQIVPDVDMEQYDLMPGTHILNTTD